MEKYISIFLVMVLLFSFNAASYGSLPEFDYLTNASLYTKKTQFEGIVQSSNGIYGIVVDNQTVLPMGRLDIDLNAEKSIEKALAMPNLSKEVKEEILTQAKRAKENNQILKTTVFSSELLDKLDNNLMSSIYYTYNGARMRSDFVFTYGLNTSWRTLDSGSYTKDTASGIVSILLLGAKSTILKIVASGKTVLDFFIAQWGAQYITGHRTDFLMMRLIYDDAKQWTYREVAGEWYLGLCTQKVTVTEVGIEQYYFSGNQGRTTLTNVVTNSVMQSQNYDSPWAKAYQWITQPQTEWVEWKVANKIFAF